MYNFGKIKESYNKIYLESFSTKDSKKKKVFEYYISKLKESKILREEFDCYNAIQNAAFNNELDSQIFIEGNLDVIRSMSRVDLNDIHNDLINNLKENGYSLVDPENEIISLFEDVLNTEKTSKNLTKITESIIKLRKTLVKEGSLETNEEETIALPTNVLSNLMVNKFNSKYSELDETTKKIIKVSLNGSEEERSELFNSTLKECVDLVNNKLKESANDLELKDKLLQTKERLLEMSFISETYIENLTKLVELKNNL
jgi:hypothetical protein